MIDYNQTSIKRLSFLHFYSFSADMNPMEEICGLIKKGVKLRPRKDSPGREPVNDPKKSLMTPSDEHMKLLVESLNKISVFTRESSPESDSDTGEFDD